MMALRKLGSSLAPHSFCVQEQEEPPELQHAMQQLQAAADVTEGPATDNAAASESGANGPSSAGVSPTDGAHHSP